MQAGSRVVVGDNAQIALDTRHNLIAEQHVHREDATLHGAPYRSG